MPKNALVNNTNIIGSAAEAIGLGLVILFLHGDQSWTVEEVAILTAAMSWTLTLILRTILYLFHKFEESNHEA